MSDKANESPPEEANEKVFGNGAVTQNEIKANPSLMPETYDKGKYTSEDDKDSEDTPMPSVDENKNPPVMENQENDIEAPTQTFAGNSPPGSPSSKRMRTSDSDQETPSPQSEEIDLGNSNQGVDAKNFYGPSTSNNFGPEPKRRSMENPVDRFDEVGPPKHRKLDRDSKPPGLLSNFCVHSLIICFQLYFKIYLIIVHFRLCTFRSPPKSRGYYWFWSDGK